MNLPILENRETHFCLVLPRGTMKLLKSSQLSTFIIPISYIAFALFHNALDNKAASWRLTFLTLCNTYGTCKNIHYSFPLFHCLICIISIHFLKRPKACFVCYTATATATAPSYTSWDCSTQIQIHSDSVVVSVQPLFCYSPINLRKGPSPRCFEQQHRYKRSPLMAYLLIVYCTYFSGAKVHSQLSIPIQ